MRPALEELNRRMLENGISKEHCENIIQQIEPFVGYGVETPCYEVIRSLASC